MFILIEQSEGCSSESIERGFVEQDDCSQHQMARVLQSFNNS